mgnify:FL=1
MNFKDLLTEIENKQEPFRRAEKAATLIVNSIKRGDLKSLVDNYNRLVRLENVVNNNTTYRRLLDKASIEINNLVRRERYSTM